MIIYTIVCLKKHRKFISIETFKIKNKNNNFDFFKQYTF